MRKTLFPFLGVLFSFLTAPLCEAYQWPVDPSFLSMGFGTHVEGLTLPGLIFTSRGTVSPVAAGEVVFTREAGDAGSLPLWTSSLVVIAHEEDFLSIYQGLPPSPLPPVAGPITPLADIEGTSWYFELFDLRRQKIVNPLLVLPPVDPPDTRPPRILDLVMEREGERISLPPRGETVVPPGVWRFFLRADDPGPLGEGLWFRCSLLLQGVELSTIEWSSLSLVQKALLPEGSVPGEPVYTGEGMVFLGAFRLLPGRQQLRVVARDLAGNLSSRVYALVVR